VTVVNQDPGRRLDGRDADDQGGADQGADLLRGRLQRRLRDHLDPSDIDAVRGTTENVLRAVHQLAPALLDDEEAAADAAD
jgi:hypothetical protein